MGNCIGGIIPYDFYELSNKEKASAEITKLCEKMKSYFHVIDGFVYRNIDWENSELGGDNEYGFETPFEGVGVILHNGFLELRTGFNYRQYFFIVNGLAWLRCLFYDIANALGVNSVYIVDEYHWDMLEYGEGIDWNSYEMTFDLWKAEFPDCIKIREDMFHEFNNRENIPWGELNGLNIDYFEGCMKRKRYLENLFPEYDILALHHFAQRYILAHKCGELFLLDEETLKPLRCGHFDAIEQNLNGAGFVLVKKNRRAYFDNKGKRKTPYKVWRFDREYDNKGQNDWLINQKTNERICPIINRE